MALRPAGFIDGARVHGETLRRALYASSNGATGVTRAGDLQVVPLSTPGGAVWIGPGGGVIATRFTDADPGQSYAVSNDAALQLTIPANNTSSPVTRHVILRVTDPQYAGESVPSDPAAAVYTVAEAVTALPNGKPYLHLATITLPANTGTVQASHITDRRRLANPRSERVLKSIPVTTADPLDSTADFEQWPDQAIWPIYVPEWATEVKVVGTWYNVASMPGTNISELAVLLGWNRPDSRRTNSTHMVLGYSTSEGSAEQRRQTVGVSDTIAVPAGWRGQTITVMSNGKKVQGSVNLIADAWASVALDLQFVEAPTAEGSW